MEPAKFFLPALWVLVSVACAVSAAAEAGAMGAASADACSAYCRQKYGQNTGSLCVDAGAWWDSTNASNPVWVNVPAVNKTPSAVSNSSCPFPQARCSQSPSCCLVDGYPKSYSSRACHGDGPGGRGACCYHCFTDGDCSDDGLACNGVEACNASFRCAHASPVSCTEDGDVCTAAECVDAGNNTYRCNPYRANASPCSAGECPCSERVCAGGGFLWPGLPSPEGCGGINEVCCCSESQASLVAESTLDSGGGGESKVGVKRSGIVENARLFLRRLALKLLK